MWVSMRAGPRAATWVDLSAAAMAALRVGLSVASRDAMRAASWAGEKADPWVVQRGATMAVR